MYRSSRILQFCTILISAASTLYGAENVIVNEFNSDTEVAQWGRFWGIQPTFTFDATKDANTNSASGSLKVEVLFNSSSGDNQFSILRNLDPVVDGTQYSNLVFDLLWDESSPRTTAGTFGTLDPGLKKPDWSQMWLPSSSVPTNAGWRRVVVPISATLEGVSTTAGVILKMWGGTALNGLATFWIDNVRLEARTVTSNPPPEMKFEKAVPGLKLFLSAPGVQYQRQAVRTALPEYSWRGNLDPVTYSLTVKDTPSASYPSFQTHIMIIPGTAIAASNWDPDWNQPHTVFFHINNNSDGSATASFRYKVNQASGNGMFWAAGALASINAPSAVGTWNLTFNPDGAISITTPQGNTTNFTMSAEHQALFDGPAYAYFGIQANTMSNIGQSSTFGQAQITGVINPISDDFLAGSLDTNKWVVSAAAPTGVMPVPETAKGWIAWTLPDTGFSPEVSTNLTTWGAPAITPRQFGDVKRALILSETPAENESRFFRLRKQL